MKRKYQSNWQRAGTVTKTTGSAPSKRRKLVKGRRVGRKKASVRRNKKQLVRTARRKLKSMIKKEIMCTQSKGAYHKAWVGEFRVQNVTANYQTITRNATRGLNNGSPYTVTAMSFTPFALKKLLDAVSVLYNGKAKALNYEATTDNFPNEGKGLQVDFTYCSFQLKVSNQSKTPLDCVVYKATANMNHSTDFTTNWSNSLNSQPWRGGAPNINVINMTPGIGDAEMRRHWSWKPLKFKLLPGQTKVLNAKWKGCVDFSKYFVNGSLSDYGKSISQQWTFVLKPDFSIRGSATGDSLLMGHYGMDGANANDDCMKSLVFEYKEVFNCLQPPETADLYEGNAVVNLMDYPAPPTGSSGEFTWNTGLRVYRDSKNEEFKEP